MQRQGGFTIIELIVVIVIIAILLTVGVAAQINTLPVARDGERAQDTASIARLLEADYLNQVVQINGVNSPSYPPTTTFVADIASGSGTAAHADPAIFTAPNQTSVNLVAASTTSSSTPANDNKPPVLNTYYYQPIRRDGTLCTDSTQACVLYRLIYLQEAGGQTVVVKSEHQQ